MRDGVRPQMDTACITQWLDAAVVRDHVAELNDFGNAPEMFDKAGGPAERLAGQVVDRDFSVVKVGITGATQILENEVLNHAPVFPDSGRTDPFLVAHDPAALPPTH